jgi:hypothetical protein
VRTFFLSWLLFYSSGSFLSSASKSIFGVSFGKEAEENGNLYNNDWFSIYSAKLRVVHFVFIVELAFHSARSWHHGSFEPHCGVIFPIIVQVEQDILPPTSTLSLLRLFAV